MPIYLRALRGKIHQFHFSKKYYSIFDPNCWANSDWAEPNCVDTGEKSLSWKKWIQLKRSNSPIFGTFDCTLSIQIIQILCEWVLQFNNQKFLPCLVNGRAIGHRVKWIIASTHIATVIVSIHNTVNVTVIDAVAHQTKLIWKIYFVSSTFNDIKNVSTPNTHQSE